MFTFKRVQRSNTSLNLCDTYHVLHLILLYNHYEKSLNVKQETNYQITKTEKKKSNKQTNRKKKMKEKTLVNCIFLSSYTKKKKKCFETTTIPVYIIL